MNNSNLSRRNFLKASALAGVGVSVAGVSLGAEPVVPSSGNLSQGDISLTRPRPAGQKPVNNLTTKPLEKGTGLGLSTVRGLVVQNHGRIRVESAPGNGSRFIVEFPAPPS